MRLIVTSLLGFSLFLPTMSHADGEWKESSLPKETIDKITEYGYQYDLCLSTKGREFPLQDVDIRDAANAVMGQCVEQLKPIKAEFLAVDVPEKLADRYIKRKQNQGVRKVLQMFMFAKASQPQTVDPQTQPQTAQ